MSRVFILLSVVFLSIYQTEQAHFLTDDYIDQVNNQATTWNAGKNFPSNTPAEYFKSILGSKNNGKWSDGPYKRKDPNYNNFPDVYQSFDARNHWNQCQTIGHVRDQGYCDSSWALSTSSALSDRLCIATNGKFNESLSAEHVTFCCRSCGDGCNGGRPIKAWLYFNDKSIVTGGDYGTNEGCQPYRVPPCTFDERGNSSCTGNPIVKRHSCNRNCYGHVKGSFFNTYTKDAYYLMPEYIENDVVAYGPVEASFDVYDDFIHYKSGVYMKTETATYLGRHSVKLIGWGVEEEVPYWLMVNSWNSTWGDEGTFKIKKDTNECGIENSITAGVPVAGKNFPLDTPVEYFKSMLGSKGVGSSSNGPVKTVDPNYGNIRYIPRTFDARKKWKNCPVGHVRDQGQCGSCWAMSTTSAFSDRLCIATDGKFNLSLSAEQLTFCCYYCGFQCLGGWPIQAWRYFKHHGIVTGGDYGTNEGCKPYRVPPSEDDNRANIMGRAQSDLNGTTTVTESPELSTTLEQEPQDKHSCKRECDGDTSLSYTDDLFYTRDAYHLTDAMIQKDVMVYGPVEASFDVYEDFMNYKYGVYARTENATYMGGHSVKLIGWGVEQGVPYWLMVNSWNYEWGDWGTFKIRRGTNECRIEDSVTGGVPLT
ncbi:uncharacterized protein LOC126836954 [Adelges cooleyi]|uniref:uncharacterized protein LOC126836954 n=1 Tax=Adelges cooleyi TaxID=133065 RepID=UPI0021805DED|nr:uncharacterized protein LOC126836954 [Adelges cooleyi]